MTKPTILVTGGAGYIGSHMVKMLRQQEYNVVVLDDLSQGHADAVLDAPLIQGSLADTQQLHELFDRYNFTTVMHFAGSISVGESVLKPTLYYQNNVSNTLNLLDVMTQHQVKQFIFSSTAAIFGEPQYSPIDNQHPKNPINPYGRSKWLVEQVLPDCEAAFGLRAISLRYFNAAGADPDGQLCERHHPCTHLIPLALKTILGLRDHLTVYGRDYPTLDGTCIRDYIHVVDLCSAHLLALKALQNGAESTAYNLGNGNGYSVQQVIDAAEKVTGHKINVIDGERRAGDPAILVADSSRAVAELGWQPQYPELSSIIEHAWHAMQKFKKSLAC